jgi:signal transduction histidine kinase
MLHNLISNSIKYCKQEPCISISCGNYGDFVKVTIKDNGMGFDVAKSDVMFRPFIRLANGSEFEGSGLGLSIVHRIVEHHEGVIDVNSVLGKGSSFTLSLPKFVEVR